MDMSMYGFVDQVLIFVKIRCNLQDHQDHEELKVKNMTIDEKHQTDISTFQLTKVLASK
jgi:hypothetical protein